MRKFSFSSLRVRLLLLVLFAVIPALGLILYTGAEQRRLAAIEAQEDALRLARSVSSSQEYLVEGVRQLLITLAQLPAVHSGNAAECNVLFADLLKQYKEQYKQYQNFVATKPNGDVFCSAIPLARQVNLADRPHFQAAIRTKDFAVSDYLVARITGSAILGFAYPVLDLQGEFKAVVLAALDVNWLNQYIANARLPSGGTLAVFDRNGTVLVHYPNPEKWVGQDLSKAPIVNTVLAQREGVVEAHGMDGIPRLFGFTALGNKAPSAYVSIGIPKEVAIAPANRILVRNLMGLGIVGALALMAAWFGSNLFILRRVSDLVCATKRLSAGDLGARTELPYGKGELGQLALAFDQLAEALETRQAEAERAEEERARLFAKTQRNLERIQALGEIGQAIGSTLDLHGVLDLLLIKIDELLPYSASTVDLLHRESGKLRPVVTRNINKEEWKAYRSKGRGLTNLLFETKTPLIVENLQVDPRVRDHEFFRRHGLVTYVGFPLIAKGEALGVLAFFMKEEHQFSNEEVEFLTTLAGQAAIAIHNSQLYEQTKEQAVELEKANRDLRRKEEIQGLLKELSQDITFLDIDTLLKKLTDMVRAFFKVDVSDVRIINQGVRQILGVSGIEAERLRVGSTRRGRGGSRWIFENRRPLVIEDITRHKDLPMGETTHRIGIRGYLGVPLFSRRGEVIGILRALTYEPRQFTQEEVDLLQQLANGAAIALENSKLLEDIKRQAGELEKANKTKDEFLGFVSHELRTPVTAVLGYAALIEDGLFGQVTPDQINALIKIEGYSKNLLSMVNTLLEATRLEAGAVKVDRHDVNMAELLEELKSTYRIPSSKEVALTWDYPSDLPVLHTDSEKLRHIVQNLIANAIKYTDRGSVSISARIVSGTGDQGIAAIEFKVSDTGIGIPAEALPTIFEMFRQVKGSKIGCRGGVGLGLHIVKKFTELLGGKIHVKSEVGKGSTFTVALPLT